MKKYPCHKKNLTSLKRIEGQVRGVQRMIEGGKYCVDILTQIRAIKGALTRVEYEVLNKHLDSCVTDAMKSKSLKEKQIKIDEVKKVIRKARNS